MSKWNHQQHQQSLSVNQENSYKYSDSRTASWIVSQQLHSSLIPCLCGCGGPQGIDHSAFYPSQQSSYCTTLGNPLNITSPSPSPLYSTLATDHYVPQAESSAIHGHNFYSGSQVTPPPTPPEEEGEKFKCLYMLVDAAISQWEKQNATPPPPDSNATYLNL